MVASTIATASGVEDRSERRRSRIVPAGPDIASVAAAKLPCVRQHLRSLERRVAENLAVRGVDRRLESGGTNVAVEDSRVCAVEDRRLDPALEQSLGLAHEELVEGVLARHEHRKAGAPPPCPSPALPEARDRPGEADRQRAVERPDVDAQLERIGGRHAEELALDEPALDLPPLGRRVPGAIGREAPGELRHALAREAVDELGRLPGLREADRPKAVGDELGEDPGAVAERARSDAELGVEERGVPEEDGALCLRCRVGIHDGRVDAEEDARLLPGIRDRRGGEEKLRLGPVDGRGPAQAPEDVRHVGAKDAAIDVRLVDDDVAQVLEDVSPAVVMRQKPDVQHVGVREDEVGPLPDLPALLGGRVAVVDRRPEARELELGEAPRLILGERLRRVEVERPLLRVGRERVQHRQVESERLPARGARRDDDVLAAPRRFQGLDLVLVELLDAAPAKCFRKPGMEVRRDRGEASLLRRDNRGVRDLLGREELAPEGGCHRHGAMVASGPLGTSLPHDRDLRLGRRRRDPG